jgi:hypothetical protein
MIIFQIHPRCYVSFYNHIRRFALLVVCFMQLKYRLAVTLESISAKTNFAFHVTVRRDKFSYNKTNYMN